MDLQPFLFWVIAGLTAACGIATVVTHNIVRAATWLLFTLAGTSGLFFLIGADLVGAIQLLVYVGGTMVLVVFGVMLTAEGPFVSMRTSSAEWAISAAVGIGFLSMLLLSFLSNRIVLNPQGPGEAVVAFAPKENLIDSSKSGNAADSSYTMVIGQGFAGVGVGPAHRDPNPPVGPSPVKTQTAEPPIGEADPEQQEAPVPAAASVIRMNYLFPFEIVSAHLLVVLIAAAYLARPRRVEAPPADSLESRPSADLLESRP